jgi:hypothetical protein
MKTLIVSVSKERVTFNGETCNFIEAGLMPNGEKITNKDEIISYFEEKYEGEEFEIVFDEEQINLKTLKI